ncbi:MAG: SnoaL-like domain-containing protein [Chitinophagaceae bacterium]
MTTQEIASRLYELGQQGKFDTAQAELFSADATSTESNMGGERETASGMEAIKEKGKRFQSEMLEMHSAYTKEPLVLGNYIFMEMGMDATMKSMGRMDMKEMCKYEVKDGKIISEEFFY